ncbi:MAG: NAD(P)-binding domain-containing protein, partial [Candidatus Omnitrophota bacterium]
MIAYNNKKVEAAMKAAYLGEDSGALARDADRVLRDEGLTESARGVIEARLKVLAGILSAAQSPVKDPGNKLSEEQKRDIEARNAKLAAGIRELTGSISEEDLAALAAKKINLSATQNDGGDAARRSAFAEQVSAQAPPAAKTLFAAVSAVPAANIFAVDHSVEAFLPAIFQTYQLAVVMTVAALIVLFGVSVLGQVLSVKKSLSSIPDGGLDGGDRMMKKRIVQICFVLCTLPLIVMLALLMTQAIDKSVLAGITPTVLITYCIIVDSLARIKKSLDSAGEVTLHKNMCNESEQDGGKRIEKLSEMYFKISPFVSSAAVMGVIGLASLAFTGGDVWASMEYTSLLTGITVGVAGAVLAVTYIVLAIRADDFMAKSSLMFIGMMVYPVMGAVGLMVSFMFALPVLLSLLLGYVVMSGEIVFMLPLAQEKQTAGASQDGGIAAKLLAGQVITFVAVNLLTAVVTALHGYNPLDYIWINAFDPSSLLLSGFTGLVISLGIMFITLGSRQNRLPVEKIVKAIIVAETKDLIEVKPGMYSLLSAGHQYFGSILLSKGALDYLRRNNEIYRVRTKGEVTLHKNMPAKPDDVRFVIGDSLIAVSETQLEAARSQALKITLQDGALYLQGGVCGCSIIWSDGGKTARMVLLWERVKAEWAETSWDFKGIVIGVVIAEAGLVIVLTGLLSMLLDWDSVLFGIANLPIGFGLAFAGILVMVVVLIGLGVTDFRSRNSAEDGREESDGGSQFTSKQAELVLGAAVIITSLAFAAFAVWEDSVVGAFWSPFIAAVVSMAVANFLVQAREVFIVKEHSDFDWARVARTGALGIGAAIAGGHLWYRIILPVLSNLLVQYFHLPQALVNLFLDQTLWVFFGVWSSFFMLHFVSERRPFGYSIMAPLRDPAASGKMKYVKLPKLVFLSIFPILGPAMAVAFYVLPQYAFIITQFAGIPSTFVMCMSAHNDSVLNVWSWYRRALLSVANYVLRVLGIREEVVLYLQAMRAQTGYIVDASSVFLKGRNRGDGGDRDFENIVRKQMELLRENMVEYPFLANKVKSNEIQHEDIYRKMQTLASQTERLIQESMVDDTPIKDIEAVKMLLYLRDLHDKTRYFEDCLLATQQLKWFRDSAKAFILEKSNFWEKSKLMYIFRKAWMIDKEISFISNSLLNSVERIEESGNKIEPGLYPKAGFASVSGKDMKKSWAEYMEQLKGGAKVIGVDFWWKGGQILLRLFSPLFSAGAVLMILQLLGFGTEINLCKIFCSVGIGYLLPILFFTGLFMLNNRLLKHQDKKEERAWAETLDYLAETAGINDLSLNEGMLAVEFSHTAEAAKRQLLDPFVDLVIVVYEGKKSRGKIDSFFKGDDKDTYIPWIGQPDAIKKPQLVYIEEGRGSGEAYLSVYRYLDSEDFKKLQSENPYLNNKDDLKVVVVLVSDTSADFSFTKLPLEMDGKGITPFALSLMNGYRALEPLERGSIFINSNAVFIGPIQRAGNITMVGSWASNVAMACENLGLILSNNKKIFKFYEKFFPSMRANGSNGKIETKINSSLEQEQLRGWYDFKNETRMQWEAYTGIFLVSFSQSGEYEEYKALMSAIAKRIEELRRITAAAVQVNWSKDIIIPLLMTGNKENVMTYFQARFNLGYDREEDLIDYAGNMPEEEKFYYNLYRFYRRYARQQKTVAAHYVFMPYACESFLYAHVAKEDPICKEEAFHMLNVIRKAYNGIMGLEEDRMRGDVLDGGSAGDMRFDKTAKVILAAGLSVLGYYFIQNFAAALSHLAVVGLLVLIFTFFHNLGGKPVPVAVNSGNDGGLKEKIKALPENNVFAGVFAAGAFVSAATINRYIESDMLLKAVIAGIAVLSLAYSAWLLNSNSGWDIVIKRVIVGASGAMGAVVTGSGLVSMGGIFRGGDIMAGIIFESILVAAGIVIAYLPARELAFNQGIDGQGKDGGSAVDPALVNEGLKNRTGKVTVGLIGGTGDMGMGLAARLAEAGMKVLIGSRKESEAQEAAAKTNSSLNIDTVEGKTNAEAAGEADIVILLVNWQYGISTLEGILPLMRDNAILISP